MSLLNSIDTNEFLEKFWDKNHLFIPKAFAKPTLSIDRKNLLAMSLDEDYETRLILQDKENWEIEYGPLENLSFQKEVKNWTLFIHNLNLYEKFSRRLQEEVNFIPSWLFDDVLCSVSTDGSTVGAHFDRYNVFIIQISGKRKWCIETKPIKKFKKDSAIKVLEKFTPEFEYTLEPGDIIFIPPECAHQGVSIGDSISLSVGFKSIETAPIMEHFLSKLTELSDEEFLKSRPSDFGKTPNELSETYLKEVYNTIKGKLDDKETFKKSFLTFLSKPSVESFLENEDIHFDTFVDEGKSHPLCFIEEVRCISFKDELWINQTQLRIPPELVIKLTKLVDGRKEFLITDIDKDLEPYLFELYRKNIIGFLND